MTLYVFSLSMKFLFYVTFINGIKKTEVVSRCTIFCDLFLFLKLNCWTFRCRLWKHLFLMTCKYGKMFLFICLLNLCWWNIKRFVGNSCSRIFSEKLNSFYTNPLFLLNCRGKFKTFLRQFLYFCEFSVKRPKILEIPLFSCEFFGGN